MCAAPSEISGQVTVTSHAGGTQTMDASEVVVSTSPVFVE
jgi:hypothetical protein